MSGHKEQDLKLDVLKFEDEKPAKVKSKTVYVVADGVYLTANPKSLKAGDVVTEASFSAGKIAFDSLIERKKIVKRG